ncbi:endonuclease/exonuclease/phosphatase family protein [Streptomyces coffeae]|uniref:Endonuclease/exonuclease/phosphatase family protein n=1 Tax=Streptomyces coffeae TaxID=621382 RepID=A0ABS1NBL4_9ACTN|nr:endonuclease/exonuclease/phosphatase family protein [Streptomyces coffeae]MBL1097474.1 endonuclease/exonuclease/phosphatase family protein [Streptomyces coffeae]
MPAPVFSRRHGMRAAAATALALPLVTQAQDAAADAPSGDDPRLTAMTFNLRYASDSEPNSWAQRRPAMRELLRRARPQLLGTQEGLYGQLRDIAHDLGPRYTWLGTGRAGGSRDEFMAVFYDIDRLEPLEYDHFWLSDTPYVIGSNTWGGAVVRMVTWVRFLDRATDGQFYALNTHLDHRSQHARERAAALITERLHGLDKALPRIVTGDFNVAAHGNPVYDAMLDGGVLVDTWDTAERRGKQYATFHGYGPLVPDGDRIDWILTSPGVRTRHAVIDTYSLDGQFPSDHLPVRVVLEL